MCENYADVPEHIWQEAHRLCDGGKGSKFTQALAAARAKDNRNGFTQTETAEAVPVAATNLGLGAEQEEPDDISAIASLSNVIAILKAEGLHVEASIIRAAQEEAASWRRVAERCKTEAEEHKRERNDAVKALVPFARAARCFRVAIGPDGVDDGLSVIAHIHAKPAYEAQLSTADFSAAARSVFRQGGE